MEREMSSGDWKVHGVDHKISDDLVSIKTWDVESPCGDHYSVVTDSSAGQDKVHDKIDQGHYSPRK
jgi:hypothetical protein